jgi:hypothetical protein
MIASSTLIITPYPLREDTEAEDAEEGLRDRLLDQVDDDDAVLVEAIEGFLL